MQNQSGLLTPKLIIFSGQKALTKAIVSFTRHVKNICMLPKYNEQLQNICNMQKNI